MFTRMSRSRTPLSIMQHQIDYRSPWTISLRFKNDRCPNLRITDSHNKFKNHRFTCHKFTNYRLLIHKSEIHRFIDRKSLIDKSQIQRAQIHRSLIQRSLIHRSLNRRLSRRVRDSLPIWVFLFERANYLWPRSSVFGFRSQSTSFESCVWMSVIRFIW